MYGTSASPMDSITKTITKTTTILTCSIVVVVVIVFVIGLTQKSCSRCRRSRLENPEKLNHEN